MDGSLEALAAKVKEIQRSSPDAKEQWNFYTTQHGAGTRDPSKHSAEFLQSFIDSHSTGALQGMTSGAGVAWGGGDGSVEYLVTKVKELQRANPQAKEQWAAFTDLNGGGTRDPSKHPADFLQGFLDHMSSGHQINPMAAAGMENPTLVDTIKTMQKKSQGFRSCWQNFCMQQGGGRMDPTKHDTGFHLMFLDHVAATAGGTSPSAGLASAAASTMGAPEKRMRDASGMAWGMGGSGDPAKDALAERVKAFQRLSPEHKNLWSMYADSYLGGVRDPSRHDANTLNEFCVNHEVPQLRAGAGLGGMGMGPVGFGAGGGMGGMGGGMGGMDPDVVINTDPVVQRIKNFQKITPENGELWRSFCGRTRDPARHTTEKLEEFCKLFSVP